MAEERWLPLNYELPNGDHVRNLYVKGSSWQLYATAEGGQALAISVDLHEAWLDRDWIDPGIFTEMENCCVWSGRSGAMISSVEHGPYPTRQEQAEAFVQTLKRSRERFGRVSFGDALYISQFSMLLPTFTDAGQVNDALVLGRWFTGGIGVSITDTARIRRYAPWLTPGMLDRILSQLELSADAGAQGILEPPPDAEAQAALPAVVRHNRQEGCFALAGRPQLEQFFQDELLHVIDHEAEYKRMGIDFPGPVLLYGPPGCGKTYAVEKLTSYLGWPVYNITSGTIGSKYIHETSRKVSEIFDQAIANAPSVIIIDELEAFLSSREEARGSGEIHMEEVAEFLRRIPDAAKHRVLLFGMTNMIESIDKAILRKGRFDHILEVGMPSREEIQSLLEHLLEKLPVTGPLGLDEIAGRLCGRPISDVAFIVREAGRLAVRSGKTSIDAELIRIACDRCTGEQRKQKKIGFQ